MKRETNEFEFMRDLAELKALSDYSLKTPLNDAQYQKMISLAKKLGLKEE